MSVRVQTKPFDAKAEVRALLADTQNAGAVVTFTGLVRGSDDGKEIKALYLEHYPGMTEHEIEDIVKEAKKRWDIKACTVIHRTGSLKPGDEIVLVICIAAHRGDAFNAANFLMDWLKTKAPFWKKEDYADGSNWVEAKEEDKAKAKNWDQ